MAANVVGFFQWCYIYTPVIVMHEVWCLLYFNLIVEGWHILNLAA